MNARLFIQIGGSSPSDPLRLIWRASRQTCLVLRTRGLATGTSKPTASWLSVERESVDCTREPWKRRIECVVHFPTLFRVVPIHSLVYFSLCENAISLSFFSPVFPHVATLFNATPDQSQNRTRVVPPFNSVGRYGAVGTYTLSVVWKPQESTGSG